MKACSIDGFANTRLLALFFPPIQHKTNQQQTEYQNVMVLEEEGTRHSLLHIRYMRAAAGKPSKRRTTPANCLT